MYERSYGPKYQEQVGKSTTEVAAMIRADIKAAVKAGDLPKASYSVTSEYFSGGSSIDVVIRDLTGAWVDCDGTVPGTRTEYPSGGWAAQACPNVWCKAREDRPGAEPHQVLTVEARAVLDKVKAIHWAYNHDGSESQSDYFDVNYYGGAEVETPRGQEFRLEQAAKAKARREANKANPKPKIDKRGLETHVSRHHRRSTGRDSYAVLAMHHRIYHRMERYDFDHDHTHEATEWDFGPEAKAS